MGKTCIATQPVASKVDEGRKGIATEKRMFLALCTDLFLFPSPSHEP